MAAVGLACAGDTPLNLGVGSPKGGGVCLLQRLSGREWDTGNTPAKISCCRRGAPMSAFSPAPGLAGFVVGTGVGGGAWGGTGRQAAAGVPLNRPQEGHSRGASPSAPLALAGCQATRPGGASGGRDRDQGRVRAVQVPGQQGRGGRETCLEEGQRSKVLKVSIGSLESKRG